MLWDNLQQPDERDVDEHHSQCTGRFSTLGA
jgi:hypothetical protein